MIWDSLYHLVLGHPTVSYLSIVILMPFSVSLFCSFLFHGQTITGASLLISLPTSEFQILLLKIPFIIFSSYTSYQLHNTYSKVHHHNHKEIKYTDNLFYTYCKHILLEVFYFQFSKWLTSCDKVLNSNLMTPIVQNSTLLDIKYPVWEYDWRQDLHTPHGQYERFM